jgi:hypothetical protein
MNRNPASLTIDPIAEFLPALTPVERASLRADIASQGILAPIMLRAGTNQVIDGRHRLEIARELGLLEVPTIEASATAFDAALSANMLRRQLTPSQRAAIAVAIFDSEPAAGRSVKVRMQAAATRAQASWAYAMTALRLRARSGPAALDRVRNGEISLQDAMRTTGAAYARRAPEIVQTTASPAATPVSVISATPAAAPAGMTPEQAAALPGIVADAYTAFLASRDPSTYAGTLANADPASLLDFADFLVAVADIAATRRAA